MRFLTRSLTFMILLSGAAHASKPDWAPLTSAEREQAASIVEKDAPAEVLFWDIKAEDVIPMVGEPYTATSHYLRIKVFTEKGKEQQRQVQIPYYDEDDVGDIAARTIKPDGTVVELAADAVFDRSLLKAGNVRVKAKSFALPAVELGAIVEYRYKVYHYSGILTYKMVELQREIPIQRVAYAVKAIEQQVYAMKTASFHVKPAPFEQLKGGWSKTTITSLPAFHDEPQRPPDAVVKKWMLVFYEKGAAPQGEEYWKELGKRTYEDVKADMKVSSDVKKIAAEAVGNATTPDEKLRRLFDTCRSRVKNLATLRPAPSEDEKKKILKIKSPANTLARGIGTSFQIDMVFAALAKAAGFEARYALASDRSRTFFDPVLTNRYFLRSWVIAVKTGPSWRFYDPGSPHVPYGMLRWREEGVKALVSDPDNPEWVTTPTPEPEASLEKRRASLKLLDDGTLEGDITLELRGHAAADFRDAHAEDGAEQREKELRESLQARLPSAELTDARVEALEDPEQPLVLTYHVRVPGYAARTGKRLFLNPSFFRQGRTPLFTASEREHPVYFAHAWQDEDSVTIALPSGFAVDTLESPGKSSMSDLGSYEAKITKTVDGALRCERKLSFAGILFPQPTYASLKRAFERVHQLDNVNVTLRAEAK